MQGVLGGYLSFSKCRQLLGVQFAARCNAMHGQTGPFQASSNTSASCLGNLQSVITCRQARLGIHTRNYVSGT